MQSVEKQRQEKQIAQLFLDLYNPQMGTHFQIEKVSDAPDIICKDSLSDNQLELEVSLLEDLPDDIRTRQEEIRKPNSSTPYTYRAGSCFEGPFEQLRRSLQKKLLSQYGPRTALVMKQVSNIWEPCDWQRIADEICANVLGGKERNYGAGVWIICMDHSVRPSIDALFCLSKAVE